jgi:hypothetical protein
LICRDRSRRCRCRHQAVIGVRTSRCLWHDTGGGTEGEIPRRSVVIPDLEAIISAPSLWLFVDRCRVGGGSKNAQRFGRSPQRTFALWRGTDRASISSVADAATPYKYHGVWWEPPRIDVDQRRRGRRRGLQPSTSTAGFCGRAYSRYRCKGCDRCRSCASCERHANGAKCVGSPHRLALWGFNRMAWSAGRAVEIPAIAVEDAGEQAPHQLTGVVEQRENCGYKNQ